MGPLELDLIYDPDKSGFGTYRNFVKLFQQLNNNFNGIKNGIINASDGGYEVTFDASIDTNPNGQDYTLNVNCYDTAGLVNYYISSRTEMGFTITPDADASIEYCAIPRFNVF